MSIFRPTLIERAYQLAESGKYSNPSAVKRALAAEGFSRADIVGHLHGPTITDDLKKRCKASHPAAGQSLI